jgi:hypothetical protein
MILRKPHLLTKILVWTPKYNNDSLTQDYGEYVALVSKKKIDFGTGVILVEFPKAKHLQGQRFCIMKSDAQRHAVGTNGAIPMYEIPMSHFDGWETVNEIKQTIASFGW